MTTGQMWWLIVGSCYIGAIASYAGLREIGFWRHRRRVARLGAEAERYLLGHDLRARP